MKRVLAVDLGGTKTAMAIVDECGTLMERQRQPAARNFEESVTQVAAAVATGVSAIGLIVPGIHDARTGMAWCPNLWGQDEVPLRSALEKRVNVPVYLDSDRTGYVMGETWMGIARGLENVVFVSIGTGIGVGILAGGHSFSGAHGIAGSAGWMTLDPEWREEFAGCGNWEAESAGPAVARAFGVGSAEIVVAAAESGDARAAAVLSRAAVYAGRGVANLISVLNPEMVVLGGGLARGASKFMLDTIREEALRWAQPISARKCRIELTQLGEDAGLLGAARLAHKEI